MKKEGGSGGCRGYPPAGSGPSPADCSSETALKWGTCMVAAKGGFRETIGRCKYDTGTGI